jgi:hypothetical protein
MRFERRLLAFQVFKQHGMRFMLWKGLGISSPLFFRGWQPSRLVINLRCPQVIVPLEAIQLEAQFGCSQDGMMGELHSAGTRCCPDHDVGLQGVHASTTGQQGVDSAVTAPDTEPLLLRLSPSSQQLLELGLEAAAEAELERSSLSPLGRRRSRSVLPPATARVLRAEPGAQQAPSSCTMRCAIRKPAEASSAASSPQQERPAAGHAPRLDGSRLCTGRASEGASVGRHATTIASQQALEAFDWDRSSLVAAALRGPGIPSLRPTLASRGAAPARPATLTSLLACPATSDSTSSGLEPANTNVDPYRHSASSVSGQMHSSSSNSRDTGTGGKLGPRHARCSSGLSNVSFPNGRLTPPSQGSVPCPTLAATGDGAGSADLTCHTLPVDHLVRCSARTALHSYGETDEVGVDDEGEGAASSLLQAAASASTQSAMPGVWPCLPQTFYNASTASAILERALMASPTTSKHIAAAAAAAAAAATPVAAIWTGFGQGERAASHIYACLATSCSTEAPGLSHPLGAPQASGGSDMPDGLKVQLLHASSLRQLPSRSSANPYGSAFSRNAHRRGAVQHHSLVLSQQRFQAQGHEVSRLTDAAANQAAACYRTDRTLPSAGGGPDDPAAFYSTSHPPASHPSSAALKVPGASPHAAAAMLMARHRHTTSADVRSWPSHLLVDAAAALLGGGSGADTQGLNAQELCSAAATAAQAERPASAFSDPSHAAALVEQMRAVGAGGAGIAIRGVPGVAAPSQASTSSRPSASICDVAAAVEGPESIHNLLAAQQRQRASTRPLPTLESGAVLDDSEHLQQWFPYPLVVAAGGSVDGPARSCAQAAATTTTTSTASSVTGRSSGAPRGGSLDLPCHSARLLSSAPGSRPRGLLGRPLLSRSTGGNEPSTIAATAPHRTRRGHASVGGQGPATRLGSGSVPAPHPARLATVKVSSGAASHSSGGGAAALAGGCSSSASRLASVAQSPAAPATPAASATRAVRQGLGALARAHCPTAAGAVANDAAGFIKSGLALAAASSVGYTSAIPGLGRGRPTHVWASAAVGPTRGALGGEVRVEQEVAVARLSAPLASPHRSGSFQAVAGM